MRHAVRKSTSDAVRQLQPWLVSARARAHKRKSAAPLNAQVPRASSRPPHQRGMPLTAMATQLWIAASEGSIADVSRLVAAGADIGSIDPKDVRALRRVLARTRRDPIDHEPCASCAQLDRDALHKAAFRGLTAAVTELVRLGADTGPRNRVRSATHRAPRSPPARLPACPPLLTGQRSQFRSTALILAAYWGHTATAVELVRLGADIEARDNVSFRCSWAARAYRSAHTSAACIVEFVPTHLEGDRPLTLRVPQLEWTALMYAAARGHTATAAELVRIGGDINAKIRVRIRHARAVVGDAALPGWLGHYSRCALTSGRCAERRNLHRLSRAVRAQEHRRVAEACCGA
jgi:hypothetical protein